MSNYITGVSEVQARFPRAYSSLYDDDGTVNESWVESDIEEAEGIVDGYLGSRYAVPVVGGNTGLLRSWALALVEELAYRRSAATAIPEKVKNAADHVRAMLEKCQAGTFSLGVAEVPAERTEASSAIVVDGDEPTFTRTDLAGVVACCS